MIAALIIVFREVIEAGLIVGIVLAATKNIPRRGLWVSGGIAGGAFCACLVAAFAGTINAAMHGVGQEMFNAAILSIAVLMLTWHNVWMARHGREMASQAKAMGKEVASGQRSLAALAIVVGVAVLREGSEIVLFLYGIAIAGNDSPAAMMIGGAGGLLVGACVSALMYLGLVKIPTRHLFTVTGWFIALLAAGMAAQAAAFLEQADVANPIIARIWDTSHILSGGSYAGKVLHVLVGYSDKPSLLQLIVYVTTLATIFTLMRLFGHAPQRPKTVAA